IPSRALLLAQRRASLRSCHHERRKPITRRQNRSTSLTRHLRLRPQRLQIRAPLFRKRPERCRFLSVASTATEGVLDPLHPVGHVTVLAEPVAGAAQIVRKQTGTLGKLGRTNRAIGSRKNPQNFKVRLTWRFPLHGAAALPR